MKPTGPTKVIKPYDLQGGGAVDLKVVSRNLRQKRRKSGHDVIRTIVENGSVKRVPY